MSRSTIMRALDFAEVAHAGQVRKYTGEPYVMHCLNVASIVRKARYWNDSMVVAALLHDTVEDTSATFEDIEGAFGSIVRIFVEGLTDISKPEDGNRAERKRIDREHYLYSLPPVQTIKLADLISNTRSITKYDKDFSKVYLHEKRLLLPYLSQGDSRLFKWAETLAYQGD